MARALSGSVEETIVERGTGSFTFKNGDVYNGGYKAFKDKKIMVRQDYGVYVTGDFDKYEAIWNDDKIGGDLHIRYNNGMEYEGETDEKGAMSGRGKYIFPDSSILLATWSQNKPVSSLFLEEPHGFLWKGEIVHNVSRTEVQFTAGNHFWDDFYMIPKEERESLLDPEIFNESEATEAKSLI